MVSKLFIRPFFWQTHPKMVKISKKVPARRAAWLLVHLRCIIVRFTFTEYFNVVYCFLWIGSVTR